jgi:hypothetical protein
MSSALAKKARKPSDVLRVPAPRPATAVAAKSMTVAKRSQQSDIRSLVRKVPNPAFGSVPRPAASKALPKPAPKNKPAPKPAAAAVPRPPPRPPAGFNEIRELAFSGHGRFLVTDKGISADVPFNAQWFSSGQTLQIASEDSGQSFAGASSVAVNIGGMSVAAGRLFINGVEYVNMRGADGKMHTVPKGSKLPDAPALTAEQKAAREIKKRHMFAEHKQRLYSALLVTARDAVEVLLTPGVIPANGHLAISASGACNTGTAGTWPKLAGLSIALSGASKFVNDHWLHTLKLSSACSGVSSVAGVVVEEQGMVTASGMSRADVRAARSAAVQEQASGMSSVSVTRV